MAELTRSNLAPPGEHPTLDVLPEWTAQTVGVLATVDDVPHAIPVSAPVRAADRRILLCLHRSRGSLARLRERPQVSLLILTQGNVAMTAGGHAHVIQEPMAHAPDYAAVAIDVDHIDDHRQREFLVESGIDRTWLDDNERFALRERIQALHALAAVS